MKRKSKEIPADQYLAYSVSQASQVSGLSIRTLWRRIRAGVLRTSQVRRGTKILIRKVDLDAMLALNAKEEPR